MNCKYHIDREAKHKCKICGADLCDECNEFQNKNEGCLSCAKMYAYRTYVGFKNSFLYNVISVVCAVAFLVLYIVSICLNMISTIYIVVGAIIIGLLLPISLFLLIYNASNLKKSKKLISKTQVNKF